MRRANAKPVMKTGETKIRFRWGFMLRRRPSRETGGMPSARKIKSTKLRLRAQSERDVLGIPVVVAVSYSEMLDR